MKIRITAEYNVKQTERGFEVLDADGLTLTSHDEIGPAMNSLAGMIENEMLDPSVFEIQVIDVIPNKATKGNQS